jgi:hypothetical protein
MTNLIQTNSKSSPPSSVAIARAVVEVSHRVDQAREPEIALRLKARAHCQRELYRFINNHSDATEETE